MSVRGSYKLFAEADKPVSARGNVHMERLLLHKERITEVGDY